MVLGSIPWQYIVVAVGLFFVGLSFVVGPRRLLEPIFGKFERDEFIKFVLLGLLFCLIIGTYWALRSLKDPLFQDIVGGKWQPRAKMLSLVVMIPLILIYSKLIGMLSRRNLFYVMSTVYGIATLVIAYCMLDPQEWGIGLANDTPSYSRILGWVWYVFVESFGSLIVALFWAFATDITTAESAKKGFFLVATFGQLGGIFFPLVTKIPMAYQLSNAYAVAICALFIFAIIPLIMVFMKTIPPSQLEGFKGTNEPANAEEKEETGFLVGLKLMFSKPYLLGMFGVIAFYEIIVTVFDYYFKIMAEAQILDKAEKLAFFGAYGSFANLATFLCLVFGISNIQRKLGLTVSLTLMPLLVGCAVAVFNFYPHLQALFWLMVSAKAINYALNQPSMKQLYIPTTKDVRYKAQAWIETFGSRGSKATGSLLNEQHKNVLISNGPAWADPAYSKAHMFGTEDVGSFWYMAMCSYLFVGLIGLWIIVALFLGRTYQKAIDENKVVC